MSEVKQFKLTTKKVPIEIEVDGQNKAYELREMSAKDRDTYIDQVQERMVRDAAGKPCGLSRMAGLQSGLLALCLYDAAGKRVQKDTIDSWPGELVTGLYKEAQTLNKLNETEGEAKNASAVSV